MHSGEISAQKTSKVGASLRRRSPFSPPTDTEIVQEQMRRQTDDLAADNENLSLELRARLRRIQVALVYFTCFLHRPGKAGFPGK